MRWATFQDAPRSSQDSLEMLIVSYEWPADGLAPKTGGESSANSLEISRWLNWYGGLECQR